MLGVENLTKLVNAIDTPEAGYKVLCYSVIAMAAYDFRKARIAGDERTQEKIERFFRSPGFTIFGREKVDGPYIIDTLKKETDDETFKAVYGRGKYGEVFKSQRSR